MTTYSSMPTTVTSGYYTSYTTPELYQFKDVYTSDLKLSRTQHPLVLQAGYPNVDLFNVGTSNNMTNLSNYGYTTAMYTTAALNLNTGARNIPPVMFPYNGVFDDTSNNPRTFSNRGSRGLELVAGGFGATSTANIVCQKGDITPNGWVFSTWIQPTGSVGGVGISALNLVSGNGSLDSTSGIKQPGTGMTGTAALAMADSKVAIVCGRAGTVYLYLCTYNGISLINIPTNPVTLQTGVELLDAVKVGPHQVMYMYRRTSNNVIGFGFFHTYNVGLGGGSLGWAVDTSLTILAADRFRLVAFGALNSRVVIVGIRRSNNAQVIDLTTLAFDGSSWSTLYTSNVNVGNGNTITHVKLASAKAEHMAIVVCSYTTTQSRVSTAYTLNSGLTWTATSIPYVFSNTGQDAYHLELLGICGMPKHDHLAMAFSPRDRGPLVSDVLMTSTNYGVSWTVKSLGTGNSISTREESQGANEWKSRYNQSMGWIAPFAGSGVIIGAHNFKSNASSTFDGRVLVRFPENTAFVTYSPHGESTPTTASPKLCLVSNYGGGHYASSFT